MAKSSAQKKVKAYAQELVATGLLPAEAIVVGEKSKIYRAELDRIKEKYGTVNNNLIVQEAKKPSNVLHDWPGWDGWDRTIASEKHWRRAAARLVGYVMCVVVGDARVDRGPVRALVSISRGRPAREYMGVFDALANEVSRQELIQRELGTIRGCKERLRNYKEFSAMVAYINEAITAGEDILAELEKKIATKKVKK